MAVQQMHTNAMLFGFNFNFQEIVGNVFSSIKQNMIKFPSSKAARRLESTTRATKECVKNKNKIRTNMAKYSPISPLPCLLENSKGHR